VRGLHVHHDPNSLAGHVGRLLAERGVEEVWHQVCDDPGSPVGSPEFPDPSGFDLVVLYGSRWSTYDQEVAHWVQPELAFLRAADAAGVPVLGLCFGGQLLASAHAARVAPAGQPEIGWFDVDPAEGSPVERGPWLQWHFDAFEVPDGAVELARSPAGPQAFALRRNLGLQFHPEADRAVLEAWLTEDLDQIEAAGVDSTGLLAGADRHAVDGRVRAERLLDLWFRVAGVGG
jgi:GMP synthase-like glutamine amidotransferase